MKLPKDLQTLHEASQQRAEAVATAQTARDVEHVLIITALANGHRVHDIANVTGLSQPRIYQIRRGHSDDD